MCIGCRARRPQLELIRCAMGAAGPSISRTAAGRGAWVCSVECFDTALRRRAFGRAWRRLGVDAVPTSQLTTLRIPLEAVITNMRHLQAAGTHAGTPTAHKAEQEG
jgi:predicted RNA-binding protein YlxR (DUF448 family)